MIRKEINVLNRAGIHARPAALIVKVANKFKSQFFIEKDKMRINGKSIMGVITLGAAYKSKLIIECDGPDENDMIDAIEELFINRFEGCG